jgi:uncharacterized protein
MIIPDINLLLYAYDQDSAFHVKAKVWWQQCVSGTESVGMLPVVLFGFVRLATNVRAFQHPMIPREAAAHVFAWLEQPSVEVLQPGPGHIENVLKLLESLGIAGNLVTDVQIAAQTLEHGAILHTTDTDFIRFRGLRWFNPIAGVGSSSQRRSKGI